MARWSLLPLLITQGLWAARRTPRLPPAPGPAEGATGAGEAVSLLALGDSIIAGVGVERSEEALPAQLACAIAAQGGRAVHWQAWGLNGARSGWLLKQLAAPDLFTDAPDIVVFSNGINDVTSTRSEAAVVERLQAVIMAAEARFPEAILFQLGLPPLGVFPALPQPLRWVLGRRSDRIDTQLDTWLAQRPRAHFLPFQALPRADQFACDGYHPAAPAVTLWAESLAPTITARLSARDAAAPSGPAP